MDSIKNNILNRCRQNSLWYKVILAVFIWICLSLFLHFKQVSSPVLDLNTKAARYVVSQVDFDFSDDEATALFKQKKNDRD